MFTKVVLDRFRTSVVSWYKYSSSVFLLLLSYNNLLLLWCCARSFRAPPPRPAYDLGGGHMSAPDRNSGHFPVRGTQFCVTIRISGNFIHFHLTKTSQHSCEKLVKSSSKARQTVAKLSPILPESSSNSCRSNPKHRNHVTRTSSSVGPPC